MQSISRQNNGIRYLLTVINVFSKYAWVEPVKSKDASAVSNAFLNILAFGHPRIPRRLQTDKGKKFFNSKFAAVTKQYGIHHFATESDQKAAVVERFNRTIKTRIWTYLSDRGSIRLVDIIQDLVRSYNRSYHRSIGMAPAAVKKCDENRLWVRLYGDGNTFLKPGLERGSMVRISKSKGVFEKGYLPNWSKEHFTVAETTDDKRRANKRVYKIEDYNGESVTGTWYPEELQHITDNQYRIERVIRRRKLPNGSLELFVKWEGLPAKFNSWILAKDRFNVARR